MALGPQFENTYWHDEKGGYHSSLPEGARPHSGGEVFERSGYLAEALSQDRSEETPIRGMLFSPHVGTQTARDPLLAPGEYRAAALHALGHDRPLNGGPPDPVGSYQAAHSVNFRDNPPLDRNSAEQTLDALVNNLAESTITTRELRQTPAHGKTAMAKPIRGVKGHYYAHTGDIDLRSWDQSTLLHELGHKRDPLVSEAPVNPDPMVEGVADASMTRHSLYSKRLDSEMQRNLAGDIATTGGYTTSAWSDPKDQAVYAATRALATSKGDAGVASIPSRWGLFSQVHGRGPTPPEWESEDGYELDRRRAHTLLLGHLMDNHPIVRQTLGKMHADIASAASDAHARYLSLTTPSSQETGEQLNFGI